MSIRSKNAAWWAGLGSGLWLSCVVLLSACSPVDRASYVIAEPLVLAIWGEGASGRAEAYPNETFRLSATVVGDDREDDTADEIYAPHWILCSRSGCPAPELEDPEACDHPSLLPSSTCTLGDGEQLMVEFGDFVSNGPGKFTLEVTVGSRVAGVTTRECLDARAQGTSFLDCGVARRDIKIGPYWQLHKLSQDKGTGASWLPDPIPDVVLTQDPNVAGQIESISLNGESVSMDAQLILRADQEYLLEVEVGAGALQHYYQKKSGEQKFEEVQETYRLDWFSDEELEFFELEASGRSVSFTPGEVGSFALYAVLRDSRGAESAYKIKVIVLQ